MLNLETSDKLISTREAAQILGVTPRRVAGLVQDGELEPMEKLPGKTGSYIFSRQEVEQLELKRSQADAKRGA